MTHLVFGGSFGIGSAVINEISTKLSQPTINIDLVPSPGTKADDNWYGDLTDPAFQCDIFSRIKKLPSITSVLWSVRYRHQASTASVNQLQSALNLELYPLISLVETIHEIILRDNPSFCILSSVASTHVSAQHFSYNILKSALDAFVRSCAVKYGDVSRARFNTVSPGVVYIPGRSDALSSSNRNSLLQRSSIPRLEPVHVNEIAQLILFILSGSSTSINGANIVADGGETLLDQYYVAQRTLDLNS
jgi:enoyl-[acyl-carrier-protein] reductase (NADH)